MCTFRQKVLRRFQFSVLVYVVLQTFCVHLAVLGKFDDVLNYSKSSSDYKTDLFLNPGRILCFRRCDCTDTD